MARPRQVVDDPTAFSPLPYGLLSVTQPATAQHWQNGITYQTRCLNNGDTTYDECLNILAEGESPAELDEPPAKTANAELDLRAATPFTVYTRFDCSPVGNADAASVAEQALAQTEPWQIERAFWTGVAAGQPVVYPHLAAAAAATPVGEPDVTLQSPAVDLGGPYDVAQGLGLLEAAMADCYGGAGVIHVPRTLLATISVRAQGGRLLTTGGNAVAAGSGYPGTGPDGTAPPDGATWIYGTAPVFRYAGQVRATRPDESIDRAANTMQMIAERTNLLGWGCCHFAVLVLLGVPAGELPAGSP